MSLVTTSSQLPYLNRLARITCLNGLVREVCGDRALDAAGRHVAHGAGARGERRQSGRAGVRGHGGHRREEHGARSMLTHSRSEAQFTCSVHTHN